jgi:hypothetical protein
MAALALLATSLPLALAPATARAEDDPALLSLGFGQYDTTAITTSAISLLKKSNDTRYHQSLDIRGEYRFGTSLIPFIEPYAKFKPWVGAEVNTDGMFYGIGGFLLDINIGPVVFTPSIGVGAWTRGNSKELGSTVEFRSMIEIGYKFENNMRLTAYLSHMSNAGIGNVNPGANTIGAYFHVPVSILFGS